METFFDVIVGGLLGIFVLSVALFEVLQLVPALHKLVDALEQQLLLFRHGKFVHAIFSFSSFFLPVLSAGRNPIVVQPHYIVKHLIIICLLLGILGKNLPLHFVQNRLKC